MAAGSPPGRLQPEDPAGPAGLLRGCRPGRADRDGSSRGSREGGRPPDGQPSLLHGPREDGSRRTGARRPSGLSRSPSAARYQANAGAFEAAVAERVPGWKKRAAGASGAILYHKDTNYLTALLAVPILATWSRCPASRRPPRTSRTSSAASRKEGRDPLQHVPVWRRPSFLARNLGWRTEQLQLECDLRADGQAYLAHIDRWVTAIGERP